MGQFITKMTNAEKELDRLVQRLADHQYCRACAKISGIRKQAECVHHAITRANMMLRYEIANLYPLCLECHRKVHDGQIDQKDFIDPTVWEWLNKVKNQSYKDYLLHELGGITKQEHLKQCKKTIQNYSK